MPDLSIVIPAYNEADRIGANLRATVDYVVGSGVDTEIIVVADAPTDTTVDVVRAFQDEDPARSVVLLVQERNRGKGAAVRRGMLEARGERRMFMDADLATPLEEIGNLLPRLQSADVVIASRSMHSSDLQVKQPLHRRVLGWGFRTLVSLSGVRGIRDSQCGFKLFTARAARDIFTNQRESGFAFDVEVLALAARFGYHIDEVGVAWRDSGRSSINPLLDPLKMFLALLRIRWRCTFGDLQQPSAVE